MKRKKRLGALLTIIFGVILGAGAYLQTAPLMDIEQEPEQSTWNYSSTEEENNNDKGWKLIDNIESEQVVVDGRRENADFPYGYNVGYIEDEVVGKAVLLTPQTSIHVKHKIDDADVLNVEYMIHPWVAEQSDGMILNIKVHTDIDTDMQIFSYKIDEQSVEQRQSISLEKFEGEIVSVDVYVTNEEAKDENCDWLVLQNFSFDKDIIDVAEEFAADGYVKSATYFADEWPINFWNSEMDNLEVDLQQIKQDGFNSIIIVIPWREFQPEISPITYNEYAFENLERVMQISEEVGLDVYARIGYTWDFYQDETENIVDRYCQLLGNSGVQEAWYAYVEKMYVTLSSYDNFKEGFLTWEDFWNTLGVCDEFMESSRREKSAFIGYQAWVSCNYELNDYNARYGTDYSTYKEIPVPKRDEPAMEAMYAFYDDFLNTILEKSQSVFPNLSMEVRLDWDVVYPKDGNMDYFRHTDTFACVDSTFTTTMYGIPMGFENVGERVSYTEAMEKTEYILQQLKLQNGGKPVYIDQFIFADNTPKFKDNAQIRESELNDYLENVADILVQNSEGYGIWTYRNYCANMIYNSQFALGEEGWKWSQGVERVNVDGSNACHMESGEIIEQKIAKVRNHFDANKYTFEFDILEVENPGNMIVSVGGEKEYIKVTEPGTVTLEFLKSLSLDVKICAEDCNITIDNVKLYSQIQQGYLYDEDNKELECATGIRALNEKLE